MKLSRILTIIAVVLVLMLSFTSCDIIQGLIPGGHQHSFNEGKCECGATDPDYKPDHKHNFVEGKCECGAEDPDYKPDHEHNFVEGKCECGAEDPNYVATTTPAISVIPAELEINAGDEIDLMFGVTVTDEGDENPRLVIEDDNDFDADTEGVYVITYKAINKFGKEATATRTIKVNKALSAITLEVQKNLLGETKWQGTMISFKNQLFVELNGDMTIDTADSGVFYNSTNAPVVLNVSGGYGVAAVINANGVVVEGRDGANGRLVDAINPVRASSTAKEITVNGEKVSVVENFAKNLVIPAGGYAIVVQNGYCGTTVDSDGRGFMNYNVIGTYGNVVRLLWADTAEVLTPYVDQAPVISGNGTIVYAAIGDTSFDFNGQAILGVTATDDNGTFDPTDDITVEIKIDNNGGYDIAVAGKYNVVLSATDGTNTVTAVRVVEVTTNVSEIKVGDNSYKTLPENFAFDVNVDKLGSYHFIIFTPTFRPESLAFTNGWGEAFVLNQYGQVVRIYDGANGKYYDADNKAGITDATKCTAAGYLKEAYASLQDGEYLVIAPNGAPGNASRAFLLKNRTIGAVMTLPGITFAEAPHECESKCEICGKCLNAECDKEACAEKCPNDHAHVCKNACETCGKCQNADCNETVCAEKCACHECESKCEHCGGCTDAECTQAACATKCQGHENSKFITINGKKFEAVDGKWLYNTAVSTTTAQNYSMIIFDKNFEGEFTTNGYGAAIVIDQYGTLVKVYDGANLGFYQGNGKETAHFTTANYATVAFSDLKDGETLIIFANDGGSNAARGFALGLRTDGSIGKAATLTGFTFKSLNKTITINGKTFTAENGKWVYNTAVTDKNAANYSMIIFDKNFEGEFTTNAYGAAIVLDKYGKLVKVYDGANLGFYQGNGKETAHFTTANYATVAFSDLKDGEILIVLPNDGVNGATSPRTFGLGLRTDGSIGQTATLSDVEFEVYVPDNKTISINGKEFTAEEGKWLYNTAVSTSNAQNYAMIIFDKNFEGEFTTNGYGAAIVLNQYGVLVKVYDGANLGFYQGNGKETAHFTTANYATVAFSDLKDGEILIIFANDGGTNAARGFALGLRTDGSIGKAATLTGVEFESLTKTITVNGKSFTAENGKWLYNTAVSTTTAQNYSMIIFDKNFEGEFTTNGYGAAIVLDASGKLVKVYDGANLGFYQGNGKETAHFTTANYATVAFSELAEGEILIIFANDGGTNAARGFALGLRTDGSIGKVATLTGFKFAE